MTRIEVRISPRTRFLVVRAMQGHIRALRLTSDPHHHEPVVATRFGGWAAGLLRRPAPQEHTAEVEISGDDLKGLSLTTDDAIVFRQTAALTATDPPLSALVPAIIAMELDSMGPSVSPVEAAAARFFQRFDTETNPALYAHRTLDCEFESNPNTLVPTASPQNGTDVERAYRTTVIAAAAEILWSRLHARFEGSPLDRCRKLNKARIAYLSQIQLAPVERLLEVRGVDKMKAFEFFAAGDLRLNLDPTTVTDEEAELFANGCPNSANVFCFAEFAFLAIEAGIDVNRWKALAPALVAAQEYYVAAFGEVDPHSGRPIPRPTSFYGGIPKRGISQATRGAIRSGYARGGGSMEFLTQKTQSNLRTSFTSVL